jgi:hypothetical protein
MVGEIAAEFVGFIVRAVLYIFVEIIFEIIVKGSGYLILKYIFRVSDPSEIQSLWAGFLFLFLFIFGLVYLISKV